MLDAIKKGWNILRRRIRDQGIRTSLLWLYARGVPLITGVPLLQFSRVTPSVYVGPQYRQNGLKYLQKQGIHAVVNLRIEKDDASLGLAPQYYCYLPTVDDQAPSIEQLLTGINFIQKVIEDGGKVYIHCGAGVGRAPTMAAAYLISTGFSLFDALEMIKKVRPFIYITPPQMDILAQFEQTYRHHEHQ